MTGRRRSSPHDPQAGLGYWRRFDSVAEAERLARRRLPGAMFDRLNRGVDDSTTFIANRRAFGEVSFRPRAAAVVPARSTRTTVLGAEVSTPVLLAPVGALRLQHPAGVRAAVAAAARVGTACAISPAAGHSLEEILVPPGSVLWYQITTALGGREVAERQLDEARARGYQAVVVTVDSGLRPKAAPLRLDARTAVDLAPDLIRHPRWTWRFVRDGMRLSVASTALGVGQAPGARPIGWFLLHGVHGGAFGRACGSGGRLGRAGVGAAAQRRQQQDAAALHGIPPLIGAVAATLAGVVSSSCRIHTPTIRLPCPAMR